jgi:hypothetical protein
VINPETKPPGLPKKDRPFPLLRALTQKLKAPKEPAWKKTKKIKGSGNPDFDRELTRRFEDLME